VSEVDTVSSGVCAGHVEPYVEWVSKNCPVALTSADSAAVPSADRIVVPLSSSARQHSRNVEMSRSMENE
jgi:hypothetical protein